MRKPPLAHRVIITQPYVPAVSTDIRRTIAVARKRLAQQAARDATEQAADELMKRGIVQHLRAVGG